MAEPTNKISELTRRDVIDVLLIPEQEFYGQLDLIVFLKAIRPLNEMPSTDFRFADAEGDICQHMINNHDWSNYQLLYEKLDLLTLPDELFCRFLEQCVHPRLRKPKEEVQQIVDSCNVLLRVDGVVLSPASEISGRSIYKVLPISSAKDYDFDVALSFAGPNRPFVERVAEFVRRHKVPVFYDTYEEVDLWGKDLYTHLADVYSKRARYCVMFVSKDYAERLWTNHERKNAQARAFRENKEYILPVRLDNTEIPGLPETVGYVDGNKRNPEEIGYMILQKVGYTGIIQPAIPVPTSIPLNSVSMSQSTISTHSEPPVDEQAEIAVEDLENAVSYASASSAKSVIYKFFNQYTPEQVRRIVAAYADNNQVYDCFGVDEVMVSFWEKTQDRAEAAREEWTRVYYRLGNTSLGTVRNRLKIKIRRRFQPPEIIDPDEDGEL